MELIMPNEIKWEEIYFDRNEADDVEEVSDVNGDDDDGLKRAFKFSVRDLVNTPFGLMRYVDNMSPVKNTKFMAGFTNFDITEDIALAIEECPGIEYLTVNGRYRFIVGIGRLFSVDEVLLQIEETLNVASNENDSMPEQLEKASEEIKKLGTQHEFWCGYVFPNGNYKFYPAKDEDSFNTLKENVIEMSRLSLGLAYFSK